MKTTLSKRVISALIAAAVLLCLPVSFTGCARSDWQGTWNRTGDATFARAILTITDVNSKGFTFSMTLYNGNVAGRLDSLRANFTNTAKTKAEYEVPDSRASISFTLNEKNDMDVLFFDKAVVFTETENSYYSSSQSTEYQMFGFEEPCFITGNFYRGEVTYLNQNFHDAGILTEEQSEMIDKLLPDEMMIRCLDCFQLWTVGDYNNSGKHDDEIGGFVYYGSNTMQKYGALIIAYDDNTVSVAIIKTDGSVVYYSNNSIYNTGEVLPLPVKKWIEDYNHELEAQANALK